MSQTGAKVCANAGTRWEVELVTEEGCHRSASRIGRNRHGGHGHSDRKVVVVSPPLALLRAEAVGEEGHNLQDGAHLATQLLRAHRRNAPLVETAHARREGGETDAQCRDHPDDDRIAASHAREFEAPHRKTAEEEKSPHDPLAGYDLRLHSQPAVPHVHEALLEKLLLKLLVGEVEQRCVHGATGEAAPRAFGGVMGLSGANGGGWMGLCPSSSTQDSNQRGLALCLFRLRRLGRWRLAAAPPPLLLLGLPLLALPLLARRLLPLGPPPKRRLVELPRAVVGLQSERLVQRVRQRRRSVLALIALRGMDGAHC
eukprot:5213046-Prymnesium_polylepis.1